MNPQRIAISGLAREDGELGNSYLTISSERELGKVWTVSRSSQKFHIDLESLGVRSSWLFLKCGRQWISKAKVDSSSIEIRINWKSPDMEILINGVRRCELRSGPEDTYIVKSQCGSILKARMPNIFDVIIAAWKTLTKRRLHLPDSGELYAKEDDADLGYLFTLLLMYITFTRAYNSSAATSAP